MAEKCIVPEDWEKFFDQLYKKTKNMDEKVEIEIEAPSVFEMAEASSLPLLGISYDPKDRILSVMSESLEHLVHKPREICVEEDQGGISEIRLVDGIGTEHFIRFSTPVR